MKTTAFLFPLLVVISTTAQVSMPMLLPVQTRVHLSNLSARPSATAKTMSSIAVVPVLNGVKAVSTVEAATVRGQGFFGSLFNAVLGYVVNYAVKAIVNWLSCDESKDKSGGGTNKPTSQGDKPSMEGRFCRYAE